MVPVHPCRHAHHRGNRPNLGDGSSWIDRPIPNGDVVVKTHMD